MQTNSDTIIKQFKLINGEDIVSIVSDYTQEGVYLEFPLMVFTVNDSDYDKQHITLIPWMSLPTEEDFVFVPNHAFIASASCKSHIEELYIRLCLKYRNLNQGYASQQEGTAGEEESYEEFEEPTSKTFH
jgi:hypothetical protein